MRNLSDKDYKMFEQLVKTTQPVLVKTMDKFLRNYYTEVVSTNNYVYAIGTVPVALVAHMDTVFPAVPDNIYYDRSKGVIWSPDGLGADDRAGVFAIIKLVKSGFRPSIILTTDEEKGGIGAGMLVEKVKEPFTDLKYLIQLDRQGDDDCVFYDCENDNFTRYIEHFGFKEDFGTFSDISVICPEWKVAGANLSVGYFGEHTHSEILKVGSLIDTIEKVKTMLQCAGKIKKGFKYIPAKWMKDYAYGGWYDYYDGYGMYNNYNYDYKDEELTCSKCKGVFSYYDVIRIRDKEGFYKYLCPDCIATEEVEWCKNCDEAYEVDPTQPDNGLCKCCNNSKSKGIVDKWKSTIKKK